MTDKELFEFMWDLKWKWRVKYMLLIFSILGLLSILCLSIWGFIAACKL